MAKSKNTSTKKTLDQKRPGTVKKSAGKRKGKPKKRNNNKKMREIKKYQESTALLIASLPHKRLAREIVQDLKMGYNTGKLALVALQVASEAYLTEMFAESVMNMLHGNRETLMVSDTRLTLFHHRKQPDGISIKAVQEAVESNREAMARLKALKNQ